MKYEIGDLVSKPVTGICKIEDILYLTSQDEKNNKLTYCATSNRLCENL